MGTESEDMKRLKSKIKKIGKAIRDANKSILDQNKHHFDDYDAGPGVAGWLFFIIVVLPILLIIFDIL